MSIKPTKGGMSQTTLNSSSTELYPCIAFTKGIKVTSAFKGMRLENFIHQISKECNKDLVGSVFVDNKDFEAGKSFIDNE